MATKKRFRKSPTVTFDSPKLIEELVKLATKGTRWFEILSHSVREEFAEKYCTWLYTGLAEEDLGATCVVVSYPRPNGKVRVYNLDGGGFSWVSVKKLTRTRRVRRASERDFEWNAVAMHDDRPESEDIQYMIDWRSLARDSAKKKARG